MKNILILLLFLLSFSAQAQLDEYPLNGSKTMRFALFYGTLSNEWSGKIEDESHSAVVFDFSHGKSSFGWGKYQGSHRYKILGDIIAVIYTGGLDKKTAPGTPLITSVFGWHNMAFSVLYTSYFQLSLGGHIGDYLYGIEGLSPHRISEQNTSGSTYYYGGAGPAVMADLALGKTGTWIHYEAAYAFTWGETPYPDTPDQKPNIFNQTIELRWRQLFFNAEIVYGLNDYGNRIKRQQFGIGLSI